MNYTVSIDLSPVSRQIENLMSDIFHYGNMSDAPRVLRIPLLRAVMLLALYNKKCSDDELNAVVDSVMLEAMQLFDDTVSGDSENMLHYFDSDDENECIATISAVVDRLFAVFYDRGLFHNDDFLDISDLLTKELNKFNLSLPSIKACDDVQLLNSGNRLCMPVKKSGYSSRSRDWPMHEMFSASDELNRLMA